MERFLRATEVIDWTHPSYCQKPVNSQKAQPTFMKLSGAVLNGSAIRSNIALIFSAIL